MRLELDGYTRVSLAGEWAVDMPGCGGPGLYWVERGSVVLQRRGRPPVRAHAGQVIALPRSPAHLLATDAAAARLAPAQLAARADDDGATRVGVVRFRWTSWAAGAGRACPAVVAAADERGYRRWAEAALGLLVAEFDHADDSALATATASALFERTLAAGTGRPTGHPAVAEALRLLQGELAFPWTLAGLARCVGMSRSSFAAAFADEIGRGPMRVLFELRMQRAAELLREKTPVAAVADALGYRAEASFRRAFRRYHGTPPGAFACTT
ncbi:AraC family transcriptional regulator [Haliangium ochraceum]|nr:AraC family transcriptional regulator [Haliangium ochraceum]